MQVQCRRKFSVLTLRQSSRKYFGMKFLFHKEGIVFFFLGKFVAFSMGSAHRLSHTVACFADHLYFHCSLSALKPQLAAIFCLGSTVMEILVGKVIEFENMFSRRGNVLKIYEISQHFGKVMETVNNLGNLDKSSYTPRRENNEDFQLLCHFHTSHKPACQT